jgi:hypothetical protein
MSEVVYRSQVKIERVKGPLRRAYIPGKTDPVLFGVHGAVAAHYFKADQPDVEPQATTIDYVVASTAG